MDSLLSQNPPPHCDLAFAMFAIRESARDRNMLLCHSSKKYSLGGLIGGSNWRRNSVQATGLKFHGTFPSATSNSLNEKLFSLHKQGRHEHRCTRCDDKSIHLIHRLYDGVRHSGSRFWRITSEDRTLWSSNGYVNLLG
jgi:hypothetical protein